MKVAAFPYYRAPQIIQPTRTQIILPAFTLSVPIWAGASDILAEYPLVNEQDFSLLRPISAFGENFIAAIRWVDGDIYKRFILFEHEDAILNYPLYTGQRIGPNAVFEIWSVNSLSAPMLDDDYTFYSSVLIFPPGEAGGAYASCCAVGESIITLEATPPSELPPGAACNPFCGTLCNTAPPMTACECPINIFETVALARAYNPDAFISPALLVTNGGATAGDGLGKAFRWDANSLLDDTGDEFTTVIRPSGIGTLSPGRWLQTSLG